MSKTILSGESFSIVSFLDNPSGSKVGIGIRPHSVKRTYDNETFTIGDFVTNGTKMRGYITGFNILEGKMFVYHTWSGVGMNLDSLTKIIVLPSQHQITDEVFLRFDDVENFATVIGVHFYTGKVKYDLKIALPGDQFTRVYNVDSVFVIKKAIA